MNKSRQTTDYILKKDLPGLPKGRIFIENVDRDYFPSAKDDEYLEKVLNLDYKFKRQFVVNNKKWFKEGKTRTW